MSPRDLFLHCTVFASHVACVSLDIPARLPLSEGQLAFLVCSSCRRLASYVELLRLEAESGAPTSRCSFSLSLVGSWSVLNLRCALRWLRHVPGELAAENSEDI